MENERDMLARLAMMAAPNETYDLTREDRASIKFALAELAKARDEVERLRGGVISAMIDFQHGLPGNATAKLSLLLDGILKHPQGVEKEQPIASATDAANTDLFQQMRDLLDKIERRGLYHSDYCVSQRFARQEKRQDECHCDTILVFSRIDEMRRALDATEKQEDRDARDRRMKALGAAEWIRKEAREGGVYTRHTDGMMDEAAELEAAAGEGEGNVS